MNSQIRSSAILLTAAIIWGFAFVAQCVVDVNVMGNFTFNGLRFLLGSVSLLPVILISGQREKSHGAMKKNIRASLIAGGALFAATALQQTGISMNHNAGKSGFITGLYTVFVPIFGQLVFKKKAGIKSWIAAVLSVSGMLLLSAGDGFDKIEAGDAVVFLAAVFCAVHILIVDKDVNGINPVIFSALQFAVCGILHLIFAFFTETITLSGISATALPILYTGLMSTAIGYTCQMIGQKDADPNLAAIILSTECVFGAISGALFLGEAFTIKGYIGCVMIFSGILLSQIKKKERETYVTE